MIFDLHLENVLALLAQGLDMPWGAPHDLCGSVLIDKIAV
jgi:hypothetical protein